VLERVGPDGAAGAGPERDKIASDLLARKQGQAWEAWLSGARAGSKIDISSRRPGPQ
jgi:hypothetical protein